MIAYFVILYAIFSIALLLAYQRTRLFPLYILKCLWTGFTILAFLWVLAMSFGQNKEYIQHPAGPFAILVGDATPDSRGHIVAGYPGQLHAWTGTHPQWVVAVLFCALLTWGLLRRGSGARTVEKNAYPRKRKDDLRLSSFIFPVLWALTMALLLAFGCGHREAIAFAIFFLPFLGVAMFFPNWFTHHGHWLLLAILAQLALPIVPSLGHFEWSRFRFGRENYSYAWTQGHIGQYFMNSLMVAITMVSITTLLGAMAAYVLARRRLAGRGLVHGLIIASISIPGLLIQVPLFLLIKDWGFLVHLTYRYSFMDSRLGLAVIYTAISLPFTIFVLTGFFRTLPATLGEAAVIDGCGQWRTFTDIYLPLALPGIATTGIFNFLGAWNEFNLGMIFMSNPNFKTLPIGLYELQAATQYSSAWAPMFAGVVLLCLPTFFIFVFLQQRIVAGLTAGGLKG